MKLVAVIAVVAATVLIACSSEPAPSQTQPANTTSPAANLTATTAPTEAPAEQPTTAAITPTAVEPTDVPTATAPAAPTPEPTTPPTDVPLPPTVVVAPTPTAPPATNTPVPAPTTTTIHTSELNVLRVTISEIPANLPKYDRHDWKHWSDADCQDARNEALIAESRATVSYRTDRRCRVSAGESLAPYTGTVVADPSKLDVDHMVPLGNAHASGAWRWTAQQRERYANHLADAQHLIAVTASANRSKEARGPEDWKPEDTAYWCQYATDWIIIKKTWALTVTQAEHDALAEMLNTCVNRPSLTVDHQVQVIPTPVPTQALVRLTSTPVRPTPTATVSRYASCDAAQAAGQPRVQGSKGSGRGFPKWMVPSARDGDGDGVVCEK